MLELTMLSKQTLILHWEVNELQAAYGVNLEQVVVAQLTIHLLLQLMVEHRCTHSY